MPSLLDRFRATGADLPWGDPLPAHGVATEGYFWKFTQPETGRILTAAVGINQGPDGPWSTVILAAHPSGFVRTAVHPDGFADPRKFGVSAGSLFTGEADRVVADLGPDARIDVRIVDPLPWPKRAFGGASFFQSIPGLGHRWHPWLLGGRVEGTATIGNEQWNLDGAQVYGEKRWGGVNFPERWWSGSAQGFTEPGACVTFAGAKVISGRLSVETTLVSVRLPDGTVLRFGGPSTSHIRATVTRESWSLHGRNPRSGIEIEASSPLDTAFVVPVPIPAEGRNSPAAIVHPVGRLNVTVRRRAEIAWKGESTLATLEYGSFADARAELQRRGLDPESEAAPPQAV